MSKSQQKQARTLNLDFGFAQPARPSQRQQRQRNQPNRSNGSNRADPRSSQNDRSKKREEPVESPSTTESQNSNKKKQTKKNESAVDASSPRTSTESGSFVMPPLPMSHDELKERNRMLIREMKSIMGADDFSRLRALIAEYVNQHTLKAPAFHTQAGRLLGAEHAKSILPELMALIPDANKRVELKNTHSDWFTSHATSSSQKKKQKKEKPVAAPASTSSLPSHDDESDLLGAPSKEERTKQDLEQDYPSLTDAPVVPNILSVGVYNSRNHNKPTVEDFPALVSSAPAYVHSLPLLLVSLNQNLIFMPRQTASEY